MFQLLHPCPQLLLASDIPPDMDILLEHLYLQGLLTIRLLQLSEFVEMLEHISFQVLDLLILKILYLLRLRVLLAPLVVVLGHSLRHLNLPLL